MERSNFAVPLAIVVAGALVAGAVFYANKENSSKNSNNGTKDYNYEKDFKSGGTLGNVRQVDENDHILGSPNAKVKIVEFSDFECPFCKTFHPTMKKIMEEYGRSGEVAWIYRHFPLEELHSKAKREAEASECAAELGGNAKFWEYVDKIFAVTPSNDGLDLFLLPQIAEDINLDRAIFEECLESGRYAKRIEDDLANAINSGGRGTPFSIVTAPNGKKFEINGALSFNEVKAIVDSALKEI